MVATIKGASKMKKMLKKNKRLLLPQGMSRAQAFEAMEKQKRFTKLIRAQKEQMQVAKKAIIANVLLQHKEALTGEDWNTRAADIIVDVVGI